MSTLSPAAAPPWSPHPLLLLQVLRRRRLRVGLPSGGPPRARRPRSRCPPSFSPRWPCCHRACRAPPHATRLVAHVASPDRLIGSADPGSWSGGHEQLRPQLAGLKGGHGERLTALHAQFTERVDSFDVVPTCGGVCFVMFGHLGVAGASARCCPYPWDPTATLNGAANRRFHAERARCG